MDNAPESPAGKMNIERLPTGNYLKEVARGVGVLLGLGLLWALEIARNVYFKALDRMGVKPRRNRRSSAFPPGQPKKHNPIQN
ncbi:MAG TPA: hypothetical protein VNF29_04790 [Candidatus Binataceae bacterium]|nr:hypothetical protein [Candidatus Binataceae bacterium]